MEFICNRHKCQVPAVGVPCYHITVNYFDPCIYEECVLSLNSGFMMGILTETRSRFPSIQFTTVVRNWRLHV